MLVKRLVAAGRAMLGFFGALGDAVEVLFFFLCLLTVSAFMLGAVVLFNWFVWRYLIFG